MGTVLLYVSNRLYPCEITKFHGTIEPTVCDILGTTVFHNEYECSLISSNIIKRSYISFYERTVETIRIKPLYILLKEQFIAYFCVENLIIVLVISLL